MASKKHQRETGLLRQCLRRENNAVCRSLDDEIARVLHDESCVRRAMWTTASLIALAAIGLGYAAALVDNFPHDTPRFVLNIISALGLAAVICLILFVSLRLVYRLKLNQLQEECRQLVKRLSQPRPSESAITPLQDSHLWPGNHETVAPPAGVDDTNEKTESVAQG